MIGYLDDIILVPLGIMLARLLIAPHILAEHHAAAALVATRPVSKAAAAFIVAIWVTMVALAGTFAWRALVR